MVWPLVESYEDVVESIRAFNEGLESHPKLRTRLSYSGHWYYSAEMDMVGPSKFVGNKHMNAAEYLRIYRELDGRDTEAVLGQWFDDADAGTPEGARLKERIYRLSAKYFRNPKRNARFHKPRGWTLSAGNLTPQSATGSETHPPTLPRTIKSFVRKSEDFYVAECIDIAVVTQGATLADVLANLQEAVSLHLDGEDLAKLGLAPNPSIIVTMELEPARA